MTLRVNDNGIDRDMTEAERARYEASAAIAQAEAEARVHAATDAAATRASGLAKLKALGLTDAEIAALMGGN